MQCGWGCLTKFDIGKPFGACPGYVVDHIKALNRGGADDRSNMQWQTWDAKVKDRWEE